LARAIEGGFTAAARAADLVVAAMAGASGAP
jgi:hypothetical protein